MCVDKYMWTAFYESDSKIELYFEGLKKSKNEWTDNLPKQLRFYSLMQMVEFVLKQKLSGDFAECGCWKGHSAYIISKMLRNHHFNGAFHLFESFGGHSERGPKDKNLIYEQTEKDIQKEKLHFLSTEEEIENLLNEFDFVKIYKGWIPERFDEIRDKEFSFVHIDVNLYDPTYESLKFFYPRLMPHGVVFCKDYAITTHPGSKKAVDDFLRENKCYLFHEIPLGGCFIIK